MSLAESPGRAPRPADGTAPARAGQPHPIPQHPTAQQPTAQHPTPQQPTRPQQRLREAPLARHWDAVAASVRTLHARRERPHTFTPGAGLPPLDEPLRAFLGAADAAVMRLPDYKGVRMNLLDLRRNPGARSAETFPALVVAARAVRHIHRTGQPVALLTHSSGNAATALRDAVLRAHTCGLAGPEQLRVISLVPARCRTKVAGSALSADPVLRRANPVVVHHGSDPGTVGELALAYHQERAGALRRTGGSALWYVPDPVHHVAAGVVRAFVERDLLPPAPDGGRVHAQAVSSGAGLLGHHYGTRLLADAGARRRRPAPCFLVQHLNTPDLVLDLHFGSFSREPMPAYTYDRARRVHRQDTDPRFPYVTHSPDEVLDPGFHTRAPVTARELSALVRAGGGGGIAVSLYECLSRYPTVRAMLRPAGVELPADPDRLRDWSLVMTLTGVLNAADRELLPAAEVLVHGSASYTEEECAPVPDDRLRFADSVSELDTVVTGALAAGRPGS